MSTDLVPNEWIYAGRRRMSGKLYHAWIGADEEMRLFKVPARVIGGIYRVEHSPDQHQMSKRVMWLRDSGDERTAEWDLEDRSALARHEAAKLEKKAQAERPLGELTLDEVRARYQRALPHVKAGIVAAVIEHLR